MEEIMWKYFTLAKVSIICGICQSVVVEANICQIISYKYIKRKHLLTRLMEMEGVCKSRTAKSFWTKLLQIRISHNRPKIM